MKLVIASDHGGFTLKQEILDYLAKQYSFEIVDKGCVDLTSVDYPDFAAAVALDVSTGVADRGILVCGTGVGMAITANKFKGVRAAPVGDLYTARLSREHNDLNVLCLGGRVLGSAVALEIVDLFLKTPFSGGRHQNRIEKIKKHEQK